MIDFRLACLIGLGRVAMPPADEWPPEWITAPDMDWPPEYLAEKLATSRRERDDAIALLRRVSDYEIAGTGDARALESDIDRFLDAVDGIVADTPELRAMIRERYGLPETDDVTQRTEK